MTAFKRNAGKWNAKYVCEGKQVWVPGGPWPTKAMARAAERQHREQRATTSDLTCAQFAERWLVEWTRPAESTRRLYAAAARLFAREFGDRKLGSIDRFTARTWAMGISRKNASVISTMYEDARNVGLVETNPFSNLRLGTEKKATIKPPTLAEFKRLTDATTVLGGYALDFRPLLIFAAWTGMRQGEIFALRWSDIDRERGVINIERSQKIDGTFGPPKNGLIRTIELLPPAEEVLDDIPRRPDELVFHASRGGRLTRQNHQWAWNKVRHTAGLPNVRFHDLRHFCATQLLEMGLDHFAVSVQLGHTDGGRLVMDRYGHPSAAKARERLRGAFTLETTPPGSKIVSEERG